ncbi:DUF2325 domain-containing protein [Methylobacterium planeticum]|uniref:DUF2325 domain-containing protein n=1 Tax=Methylobacterium planeticum TaxID=2615211 RepID=A0A6N6MME4_9HYPH|nr:DUF2325 domain-containing protein [Methylobacterium planeticum]KAB1069473.1 DUF2325 domain-containing protein [Methylobacterium planeticum]
MAHGSHLDGAALRALTAGRGQPDFVLTKSGTPADRPRDRIWELADNLHCSIVGTCLTNAEARSLLAKLGVPDARTMSEHKLHGQVVYLAGRRDGGAKLLQKMLDRRHEREIRRFDTARTLEEVRALWRESLERGEIPGAYWAAITHPATDWGLVQDIFGEVHMLSHLVGQSNRADIRRLRQLEADLSERAETIAAQERRIQELMHQRDALTSRNRTIETAHALAAASAPVTEVPCETKRSLAQRLAREQAHAEALEEKVAVLTQACGRLGADLEAEIGHRRGAEAELAACEDLLSAQRDDGALASVQTTYRLDGRTLLYVGGRPRHVANLRRFVKSCGGQLLSHDGGMEESLTLLPGLIGQSDVVVFPVDCVSHEATSMAKRYCEASRTLFLPLRSASLASFVHAVTRIIGCADDARSSRAV